MQQSYQILLASEFILALITFFSLFFISAPYGKFVRKGWGPIMKAKWGWMIMELPPVMFILYFFLISEHSSTFIYIIFFLLWQSHYVHRSLIYPFKQSGKDRDFPMAIMLMAIFFNCINGFINGYEVFIYNTYSNDWLYTPQFIIGLTLFISGYTINKQSDRILKNLRKPGETDYKVPNGGMFKYVSAPHYLGEIIEWTGWAILTWSWSGLAFAVYTFANLAPRAVSHHKWYFKKFKDYPGNRKALIPFIW
ncbi:MAG: methyltransferase [Bacteroidota bacterium]